MGWQTGHPFTIGVPLGGGADIGRYKRVIGDALRYTGTEGAADDPRWPLLCRRQLNRMLELGRPEYLRLS